MKIIEQCAKCGRTLSWEDGEVDLVASKVRILGAMYLLCTDCAELGVAELLLWAKAK